MLHLLLGADAATRKEASIRALRAIEAPELPVARSSASPPARARWARSAGKFAKRRPVVDDGPAAAAPAANYGERNTSAT